MGFLLLLAGAWCDLLCPQSTQELGMKVGDAFQVKVPGSSRAVCPGAVPSFPSPGWELPPPALSVALLQPGMLENQLGMVETVGKGRWGLWEKLGIEEKDLGCVTAQ